MRTVSLDLLDTGACRVTEHDLIQGGAKRALRCHALVGVISHPSEGLLLWDTGYAPRILEASEPFPYRLYRMVTPLLLDGARDAKSQLADRGVQPADIRTVIVSHFHADHIAGLRDFPDAAVVSGPDAWRDASSRRGFRALLRGVLPSLLPADLGRRSRLVDQFHGGGLPGIGRSHDLLGDGTILLFQLPGHARGQLGALLRTENGPVLLAADACWHSRSIRERRPPSRVSNLIVDDPRRVMPTIAALADLQAAIPGLEVIPTHCPEVYERHFGRLAYLS